MSGRGNTELLAQIEQRLQAIESSLAPGPRVRLQASNPDALLGQDTVVFAQLNDGKGRPLVDAELTAFSTWGLLSGRAGLRRVQGNSITVRSDHLGLCRLRLAAAPAINLSEVEQASLGRALAALGEPGDSPRDSAEQLAQLASEYRAAGNDSLRRAVDAYYQRYGIGSAAELPIDSLSEWPRVEISVFAWLNPQPEVPGAQLSGTVLSVSQRNWFYAWLWAYRQQLQQHSSLGASLEDIQGDDRSGSGILTDMFSRIDTFMSGQSGLVGQDMGRRFAADNLNVFLEKGLAKVPEKERAKVLTGVTGGVTSLASERDFSNERFGRAGARLELDSRIEEIDPTDKLDDLDGRVGRVEDSAITGNDIAGLRAEILGAARNDANTRFDLLDRRVAELGRASVTQDALDGLRAEILEAARNDANTRFEQLDRSIAELGRRAVTVDRLDGLQAELTETLRAENRRQLQGLEDRIKQVEDTAFTRDDVGNLRRELLGEANRNSTRNIDDLRRDLTGRISTVDNRVSRVDGRVTAVDGRVTAADGRISAMDTRINRIRPVEPIVGPFRPGRG